MAKSPIMFLEEKEGVIGDGRIGRVSFAKTGRTLKALCEKPESPNAA